MKKDEFLEGEITKNFSSDRFDWLRLNGHFFQIVFSSLKMMSISIIQRLFSYLLHIEMQSRIWLKSFIEALVVWFHSYFSFGQNLVSMQCQFNKPLILSKSRDSKFLVSGTFVDGVIFMDYIGAADKITFAKLG